MDGCLQRATRICCEKPREIRKRENRRREDVAEQSFDENIIKGKTDDSKYRVLILPNGLRALLVHNPEDKMDKAAAALSVGVGM